jgi:hypothetical protein
MGYFPLEEGWQGIVARQTIAPQQMKNSLPFCNICLSKPCVIDDSRQNWP